MLSVRAARRYGWRLAGGRLVLDEASLHFVPNRLERRYPGSGWACPIDEVVGVRLHGKIWLVVETAGDGAEKFRVFGAAAVAPKLEEALHAAGTESRREGLRRGSEPGVTS